jgi:AraC-like DNA-binding protein
MEDRLEGLEHGADGYIVKPFNIDELMTTIDNILKNRQRIRGKFSGAHQEDKIKPIEVKGNSDKLMERIMVVINDHLDDPDLRVEMLSEEVGLSRAQLHRRMKEITGISTGEFIRKIRLKKAAELLTEKKVNISQVAYMVGFSSQTHFSTAFRKFYGISPTEFMNRETEQ